MRLIPISSLLLAGLAIAASTETLLSQQPRSANTPSSNAGPLFDNFTSTLSTLQTTFFNGSYWPGAEQWQNAFLGTLIDTSLSFFTSVLNESQGVIPGSSTASPAQIQADVQHYYGQIQDYFPGEDIVQIFGAAYDDVQWVVLEWLAALRFINAYDTDENSTLGQSDVAAFAHRAHVFYNVVQDKVNTSLCGGGLTWNPALATYKNAITNELFVASSVGMYLYWPGDNNTNPYPGPSNTSLPALAVHDPLLLSNAKDNYAWLQSHNFTNSQGLYVDGFHLSPNQTTCNERDEMVYTYNQGVVLSGLRGLWEATGDTSYLADGYALVATVVNATGWQNGTYSNSSIWAGLGRNGTLEDYCDAPANCSQDAQLFKGIYFHHLQLFCEPLPSQPLVPGLTYTADSATAQTHANECGSYTPWIVHNALAALSTRNASGIIGGWWNEPAGTNGSSTAAAARYVQRLPPGAVDYRNAPGVLGQPPWSKNSAGSGKSPVWSDRLRKMYRRDVNDQGLGRTVNTEASGLSVVEAAAEFSWM